jgi:polysaccharide pyruvyl transferase WcaK-like protein
MPTALLAGAYGQGNLGDDALLRAFSTALPDWRIRATASDPEEVRRAGCEPVPARRPTAVARAVLTADAVILGGGTVFKLLHRSTERHPLALLGNAAALVSGASIIGRPVAAVGVGAGDLTGWPTRLLSRVAIGRSRLVILRDEESADRLVEAGLDGPFRVGADPAWSLLSPPGEARSASHGPVLVVPSHLATGDDGPGALLDRLVAVVDDLVESGIRVQLQSWQHGAQAGIVDDDQLVDQVAQRVPPVTVLPPPASLPEAVAAMEGASAALTFRFHALVAAGAAGVPAVAVNHEAKLTALARRLGQQITSVDYDPALLADQIRSAVQSAGPSAAAVKEQIDLADEGFRLLRVLLTRGAAGTEQLGALPLVPNPQAQARARGVP